MENLKQEMLECGQSSGIVIKQELDIDVIIKQDAMIEVHHTEISTPVSTKEDENSDSVEISNDKAVLKSFIALYEGLPVLWNPTDSNYMNRNERNAALDKLLSIYIKSKPGATRADVKRKINTLRSNYRKELKKIEDSKKSGAGVDDVYLPTSWVFYSLQFINKFEQPVNANLGKLQGQDYEEDYEESENTSVLLTTSPGFRSSLTAARPMGPLAKKARNIGPIARQNKLLQKACSYLNDASNEPHIPTIAKAWGEKLLQLDPQQRAFAEKAVNDVLFEASLGTLNRHSVKINEGFSYQSSTFTSPANTSPYMQQEGSSDSHETLSTL